MGLATLAACCEGPTGLSRLVHGIKFYFTCLYYTVLFYLDGHRCLQGRIECADYLETQNFCQVLVFFCSEAQEQYYSIILSKCFNFEEVQINLNLSANHSFLSPFSVVWVKVWGRAGLVWVSLSFPQECKSGKLQNCCLSPSLSVSVFLSVCMHSSTPKRLEAKAGGWRFEGHSDLCNGLVPAFLCKESPCLQQVHNKIIAIGKCQREYFLKNT